MKEIRSFLKNERQFMGFIIVEMVFTIASYYFLPDEIAVHWSNGNADGYLNKFCGIFFIPAIHIVFYSILFVIPHMRTEKETYQYAGNYIIKKLSINVLFFIVQVVVVLNALGIIDFSKLTGSL